MERSTEQEFCDSLEIALMMMLNADNNEDEDDDFYDDEGNNPKTEMNTHCLKSKCIKGATRTK